MSDSQAHDAREKEKLKWVLGNDRPEKLGETSHPITSQVREIMPYQESNGYRLENRRTHKESLKS